MNNVIENIKRRRTTRIYKDMQVEQEKLELIMDAALWAPSSMNKQPWHFTVVQDRDLLDAINLATKEAALLSEVEYVRNLGNNEKLNIFYDAPTVIMVSVDETSYTPIMDISAASQNILLAAESLDLGTCWNGMISILLNTTPDHQVVKELKIPKGYKLSHAIVVGYKANEASAPERREGLVHYL